MKLCTEKIVYRRLVETETSCRCAEMRLFPCRTKQFFSHLILTNLLSSFAKFFLIYKQHTHNPWRNLSHSFSKLLFICDQIFRSPYSNTLSVYLNKFQHLLMHTYIPCSWTLYRMLLDGKTKQFPS